MKLLKLSILGFFCFFYNCGKVESYERREKVLAEELSLGIQMNNFVIDDITDDFLKNSKKEISDFALKFFFRFDSIYNNSNSKLDALIAQNNGLDGSQSIEIFQIMKDNFEGNKKIFEDLLELQNRLAIKGLLFRADDLQKVFDDIKFSEDNDFYTKQFSNLKLSEKKSFANRLRLELKLNYSKCAIFLDNQTSTKCCVYDNGYYIFLPKSFGFKDENSTQNILFYRPFFSKSLFVEVNESAIKHNWSNLKYFFKANNLGLQKLNIIGSYVNPITKTKENFSQVLTFFVTPKN